MLPLLLLLASVVMDGQTVPFTPLGQAVAYEGVLKRHSARDPYSFTTGRAFKLDERAVLRLVESHGDALDCAGGADYVGPTYMILRLEPGKHPEIIRTTEGAEVDGGSPLPRAALADFPGELPAGTYVITADYVSHHTPCHVEGSFTLAE